MTKEEINTYLINVGQSPAETEQEKCLYSLAKQFFEENRVLEKENEELKKVLAKIRNETQVFRPLNSGDITSNIKDYISIIKTIDILKPMLNVIIVCDTYMLEIDYQGVYERIIISKEQYEILKEWKEND